MASKKTGASNSKSGANKKKNTSSTTTNKKTVPKSSTIKKNTTSKTTTKKSTSKDVVKKVEKENVVKNNIKVNVDDAVKEIKKEEIVTKQEKIEKEVIDEINNIKIAKIENAKYKVKKRDKTLLGIGILISLLGIIALIISLIANRIIDREFLSDSVITLMICGSIIIEGFGAFIIINET